MRREFTTIFYIMMHIFVKKKFFYTLVKQIYIFFVIETERALSGKLYTQKMEINIFKKIFLPLQQQLYREAFRLLGDSSEAEDAVQNLYLRLWEQRDILCGIKTPQAYCNRLLRNICIDRWRQLKKCNEFSIDDTDVADENLSAFEKSDEKKYVQLYLDALPLLQRRVLQMRIAGHSYKEIATVTGIAEVTVRVIISRLRKGFKTYINNK